MRWRTSSLTRVALGALVACGGTDDRGASFGHAVDADPTPVVVLRNDSSRTLEGHRVAELDVLMAMATNEATARATLQHVIDSVAAADTLAAAVRVTGFVLGEVDPASSSADVVPVMRATWGPIDTIGFTGPQRRSRYRTNYVILRPFPQADTEQRP